MIDCIYTDGTPASQVLLHFKQGERTWKAMTDGNGNVIFLCLSGLLSRLMTCGKKRNNVSWKGFNVLDHAAGFQLVLEAEDKPMLSSVPWFPPKQGTPPPVTPVGVETTEAEARFRITGKTVHVINHLNERC